MFLSDSTGAAAPMYFRSYKWRMATRSVMAAEVIVFSYIFDCAYTLGNELSKMLDCKVPTVLRMDCKSLFDVISKGSWTSEKRTMIDISAVREA